MRALRRSISSGHLLPRHSLLRHLRGRAVALLRLWNAREFERHWLASLNDAQLRDMRLTRRQVREEAAKPFWKA